MYPSSLPSGLPTLQCHDNSTYRSPINDLTCDDHKGTNCVQWRVLGLNTSELGELIEQCPETCNIPCGAFLQFSISVSFHLSSIPGLLDSNSKKKLEDSTYYFISEFVDEVEPDFIFELDKVELLSQSLVEPAQNRRLRSLQEQSIRVSVLFDGFTIGLTNDGVSNLLVSGIDSPSFTTVLRESDDVYATAVISSASQVDTLVESTIDEGSDGASTATVVVSTLVSFSILTFFIGALVYHRRSGHWVPQMKLPQLRDANVDEEELHGSPRHSIGQQYLSRGASPPNILSQPGSLLSFDDSRAGGTVANNSTNGFINRLMLSLSRSRSSTDPDDSTSHASEKDPAINPIVSPMSDDTQESIVQEHPLSNIIPPMIVIDNIDDDAELSASGGQRKKPQVPSKRVEASSAFISTLRDNQNHPAHTNSFGMI